MVYFEKGKTELLIDITFSAIATVTFLELTCTLWFYRFSWYYLNWSEESSFTGTTILNQEKEVSEVDVRSTVWWVWVPSFCFCHIIGPKGLQCRWGGVWIANLNIFPRGHCSRFLSPLVKVLLWKLILNLLSKKWLGRVCDSLNLAELEKADS